MPVVASMEVTVVGCSHTFSPVGPADDCVEHSVFANTDVGVVLVAYSPIQFLYWRIAVCVLPAMPVDDGRVLPSTILTHSTYSHARATPTYYTHL